MKHQNGEDFTRVQMERGVDNTSQTSKNECIQLCYTESMIILIMMTMVMMTMMIKYVLNGVI